MNHRNPLINGTGSSSQPNTCILKFILTTVLVIDQSYRIFCHFSSSKLSFHHFSMKNYITCVNFYIRAPRAMRFCGAVILLTRCEFGHERNKISHHCGCVWTVCYMSNLWHNIVILPHIFILGNTWCDRSYFVFDLRSFEQNRECDPQVLYFCVFSVNIC